MAIVEDRCNYIGRDKLCISPNISFWEVIPNGVSPGKMVEISGRIPFRADEFQINFICDQNLNSPLHLSVRFNNRIVVRNSRISDKWGAEEKDGGFPFETGKGFLLTILTERDGFHISVNGVYCFRYAHRLPFVGVKMIFVKGSVFIDKIRYIVQGQYVDQTPPRPLLSLVPPIRNPKMPLIHRIPDGLQIGMMIYISGMPISKTGDQLDRFTINLNCKKRCIGENPPPIRPDTAFHLDVRFFNNSIVRNTHTEGQWGQEELDIPYFPFQQGVNFDMVILVQSDRYLVAVNGQRFIQYVHRIGPLSEINRLDVKNDIIVTCLRFA